MTDAQFIAWLQTDDAIRCALVEVDVRISGVETTLYLASRPYTTGGADTPSHTAYLPVITGGVAFSEALSLDGQPSLSWGDIEIDNLDGSRDAWLGAGYVWANRRVRVSIGDPRWPRADFRQVFDGVVGDLDSRAADTLNLRLLDKLQRLNAPMTEATLGGTSANKDRLIPLAFGECHNVTPLLVDPATLTYQVHAGAIEGVIEVRDNGAPLSGVSVNAATGRFTLGSAPVGTVTASVQGDRSLIVNSSFEADSNADGIADGWITRAFGTATGRAWSLVASPVSHGAKAARAYHASSGGTTGDQTGFVYLHYSTSLVGDTVSWSVDVCGTAGARVNILLGMMDAAGAGISYLGNTARALTGTTSLSRLSTPAVVVPAGTARIDCYVWVDSSAGPTELIVDAAQLQRGNATAYNPDYAPDIATIVQRIVTGYGPASTRFAASDLDTAQLTAFAAAHPQPVGLYAAERTNVLAACQALAASVGAQVVVTTAGLLRLVKLALPAGGAAVSIGPQDIVAGGLRPSDRPAVRAACKLGFCRNWTVQTSGLAGGLPAAHAELFGQEWLSVTSADAATAAAYRLDTQPQQDDTLLLVEADAIVEADRRRDLWKTPRTVFTASCLSHLLLTELGDAATLTHPRFGLSAGVAGLVLAIRRDWLGGRVELDILT